MSAEEHKDALLDRAKSAVSEDEYNKDVKAVRTELKKRDPKILPRNLPWISEYVYLVGVCSLKTKDALRIVGRSRGHYCQHITKNPIVVEYISDLKKSSIEEYGDDMRSLISKSLQTLETIIDDADTDATRLKAIEMVLKRFNLITDKHEVELSGSLQLPTINIVTEKNE